MADLVEAAHWFSGDLILSASGDLARVSGADRARQRVLRRVMTAKGAYLFNVDYGAGLPARVGDNANKAEIAGVIRSQMRQEKTVAQEVEPSVVVDVVQNAVIANVRFLSSDGEASVLAFEVPR